MDQGQAGAAEDRRPWLTLSTVALCALVYLAARIGILGQGLGIADAIGVHGRRWWTLLTAPWIHYELWHLAFNCYWLWLLGARIECALGPARWAALVGSALLITGMAEVIVAGETGHGASGVVYALFGFVLAQRRDPRYADLMRPQMVTVMLVLLLGFLVANAVGLANVGNAAHLSGIAFGAALGLVANARWRMAGIAAAALLVLGTVIAFCRPHHSDPQPAVLDSAA